MTERAVGHDCDSERSVRSLLTPAGSARSGRGRDSNQGGVSREESRTSERSTRTLRGPRECTVGRAEWAGRPLDGAVLSAC